MSNQQGVISRYQSFLPVSESTPRVSLNEGSTPLIPSQKIVRNLGKGIRLWFKHEGMNPTGSFKDRGMTVAISKALERNAKAVICASTGNTSSSAAAYSARANLKCVVLVPDNSIAKGKLAQSLVHGAQVVTVSGLFDEALKLVLEISKTHPIQLVNSLNPDRIEGQKTAAFEICDALGGKAPDYHVIPVGNAGNITAYWKGYREYHEKGKSDCLPVMVGFEPEGAAPIAKGRVIKNPETIATAIRIGNPASWKQAEAARDESGGTIDTVTDGEILEAYRRLASEEGIFVEPASAASVAGVLKLAKKNYFKAESTICCTLTGHGLKDPDRAMANVQVPKAIQPEMQSVLKAIGF
jgi:threonine synthase